MAQPYEQELSALRQLLLQALELADTIEHPSKPRLGELLGASVQLTDDLLTLKPAAALGSKGGTKTAERGPDYFREIAAKRKTKAGGRPKKITDGEVRAKNIN
jgi:hypothetical protein